MAKVLKRIVPCMSLAVLFTASRVEANAPDITEGWHELWREVVWDISIIGVIFAIATLYLLIHFRRSRVRRDGKGKPLTPLAAIGWVLIPVFVFLADDIFLAAKNYELWNQYRAVPANSYVVDVEGGMWSWDFTHQGGIAESNELHVAVGRPVHIRLTSRDVVHSFFVPDYKVKWDAVPGKTNYLWFNPVEPGEHVVTCTEYCGAMHSSMYGKIIVMPKAEFDAWLEAKKGGKI